MNFRMIKQILGWILLFEAMFLLIPLVTALVYHEMQEALDFLISIGLCLATGGLFMIGKPKTKTLYAREGIVIVSLSWLVLSLFGSLPFLISGAIPSFVDAFFETVSGFTTTGASILSSVENLPKSILLWRSFTHWIGGMGVLVFIMAFIPLSGAYNMHLMKAESPGPSVSKLVPKVKTTALILYSIYIALTLLEFIVLICAGMSVFDSINTAFGTAGTGGFAIKNNSFDGYSPALQIIVTVFMLIFSINFNSYYLILRGKLKDAFNSEVRWFLAVVAGAIAVVTLNISSMYGSISEALRHAAFSVSSIVSTTGYATQDFDLWPAFSKIILLLVMFMGACAGSTGGGVKVSRLLILFKSAKRELNRMIHPKKIENVTIDGRPVGDDVCRSVISYFGCYMLLFAGSVTILSLDPSLGSGDLVTGFTSVLTTLSNVGPGLAQVGPTQNFAFFSPLSKVLLTFNMLAGRLELFPMILLFSPVTWKK